LYARHRLISILPHKAHPFCSSSSLIPQPDKTLSLKMLGR
jgi:hypothetical protein